MSLPRMVLKFGGTSVATVERLKAVAHRIAAFRRDGWAVAVVVSAMGDETDKLLALASAVAPTERDGRELDQLLATGEQRSVALLALALREEGVMSRSLTAWQCGLHAEGRHGCGTIADFPPEPVSKVLEEGAVAVVAGFQAMDFKGDVITLGRGGSDLSAIALAASLDAKVCSIFTDVGGVYTADPRLVPHARKLSRVSLLTCLDMASCGARVLQARCVEMAARLGVPLYVGSSFDEQEGTWIMKNVREVATITALAHRDDVALLCLEVPEATALASLMTALVEEGARPFNWSVTTELQLWLPRASLDVARTLCQRWKVRQLELRDDLASLSLVGPGLADHPEVLSALMALLRNADVPLLNCHVTSGVMTVMIPEGHLVEALQKAHRQFIEELS